MYFNKPSFVTCLYILGVNHSSCGHCIQVCLFPSVWNHGNRYSVQPTCLRSKTTKNPHFLCLLGNHNCLKWKQNCYFMGLHNLPHIKCTYVQQPTSLHLMLPIPTWVLLFSPSFKVDVWNIIAWQKIIWVFPILKCIQWNFSHFAVVTDYTGKRWFWKLSYLVLGECTLSLPPKPEEYANITL